MADTKTPDSKTQHQGNPAAANEKLRSQANKAEGSQAIHQEQAKAQVSGQHQEKGAIGGGSDRSQTGEPGRARNELDKDKNPTGQQR